MIRPCWPGFFEKEALRRMTIFKGDSMKQGIHPEYKETTITCVCGNVVHTRSTKQDIKVEVCSKCHPFMTGKQKIMDTAGRVERFNKRYAKLEEKA